MSRVPKKLLQDILDDPYYSVCARHGSDCWGRITLEHAIIVGGSQLQRKWAILPLCWYHHLGEGLHKALNVFLALRRATEEELAEFPRSNFPQQLSYLTTRFGREYPALFINY